MDAPSVGGLIHQVSPALGYHLRGRVFKKYKRLGWDAVPYLRGFSTTPVDPPAHTTLFSPTGTSPGLEWLPWNEIVSREGAFI